MGRGIALAFAWAGHDVSLVDSEERTAGEFMDVAADVEVELERECRSLVDAGVIESGSAGELTARIDVIARADSDAPLNSADVVFEAVAEILEIKQSVYAWLGSATGKQTTLASTTSTMLSDTLAEFVERPERFTNAHWLNPAYLIPLVEVSPAEQTRPDVVASLCGLLESIGKVPVVCSASPGYIVSRIQALVLNEAVRLVEEGVASAEDVDRAIRTGFGPRYTVFGPLEFIDWGGGDILYHASNYLSEVIDNNRFKSPDIVRKNMESGRTGMREGQGFYDWRTIELDDYRRDRLAAFAQLLGGISLLPKNLHE